MKTRQDCSLLLRLKGSPYPDETSSQVIERFEQISNFIDSFPEGRFVEWYTKQYNHYLIRYAELSEMKRRILRDSLPEDLSRKWWFMTVGYDDRIITPEIMKRLGNSIATKDFFSDVMYVHEKHRTDGSGNLYTHHHTHFLFDSDLSKSRIIDRVYATVKKYVTSKNFVDVKGYKDRCGSYFDKVNYIEGNKKESKMECVRLDDIWRAENGLQRI